MHNGQKGNFPNGLALFFLIYSNYLKNILSLLFCNVFVFYFIGDARRPGFVVSVCVPVCSSLVVLL